ncbi:MAG TPA: DUF2007 domain-containing protein [Ignavibacteria bacterium]|nr:DUF2007 domain-containing protein [Ignavibacteria bacterium]
MLVTVFTSDNIAIIQICKQILDENNIRHMVTGEFLVNLENGSNNIMIKVLEEDAEKAREVLREIK